MVGPDDVDGDKHLDILIHGVPDTWASILAEGSIPTFGRSVFYEACLATGGV